MYMLFLHYNLDIFESFYQPCEFDKLLDVEWYLTSE